MVAMAEARHTSSSGSIFGVLRWWRHLRVRPHVMRSWMADAEDLFDTTDIERARMEWAAAKAKECEFTFRVGQSREASVESLVAEVLSVDEWPEEVNADISAKDLLRISKIMNLPNFLSENKVAKSQPRGRKRLSSASHKKSSEVIACHYCDKSFVHADNMKRHIRKFHELDKGFMCSFCGEVFGDSRALSDHELRLHADEFDDEAALTTAEVNAARSYGCSQCHRTFARTSHLHSHVARVHSSGERPTVVCVSTDCDAVFDNKWNMMRHVSVVHQSESIYECEMCSKQFGFLLHLKTHRSTDHGLPDGICQVQDPWLS